MLDCIVVNNDTVVSPKTDALGRSTGKTIEVDNEKIAEEKIAYVKFGDHATNLPSNISLQPIVYSMKALQQKNSVLSSTPSSLFLLIFPWNPRRCYPRRGFQARPR